MPINSIENLSTDLIALLEEYSRLKELESHSFDFQLTEKQQYTIQCLIRTGHRSSMTGKHCGGNFHLMLYLNHEGKISKNTKPLLYCSMCGEAISIENF